MRKVSLFIAQSLDGKIARLNHDISWLTEFPNPEKLDFGYGKFISEVDTVVMGRKTYEELEKMNIEWPYEAQRSCIFSSQKDLKIYSKNTEVVHSNVTDWIKKEKGKSGETIWIVGGERIISELINQGLVDYILITTVPILIGEGVPLFNNIISDKHFTLQSVESFSNGMVNTVYHCSS